MSTNLSEQDSHCRVNRRRLLRIVGATGIGGVAGCLGGEDDTGDEEPEGEPTFEVASLELTEATVPWGEPVGVTASVENVGDAEGSQPVEVTVDDETIETEELALAADEKAKISVDDVATDEYDSGEHSVGVSTDDDEETAVVTFEDRMGPDPRVLVFSATDGWRHANIETGNARIQEMSEEMVDDYPWRTEAEAVAFDVIDDPEGDAEEFPDDVADLEDYDVVIWNNTTGSVLDEDQQAAFREYIENGGGYAGVHSASDTHYDWEWYGDLVGAWFTSHQPGTDPAEVHVVDRDHPSTAHLDDLWERTDEWYDWQEIPTDDDVEILLEIDHTTYDGSVHDGQFHPIGWYQDEEDKRSWYTAGGHTTQSWSEDAYVEHARKGFMWAAGWLTIDDLEEA